jgi:hypothetical protein
MVSYTNLDHPSKNGKNKYDIKCNFSFILHGIAMPREAVFLPPLSSPWFGVNEKIMSAKD